MIRLLMLFVACALLTGCGGGGGGGHEVVAPVVAALAARPMLFAYFGVMNDQIKATAAHVNALMPMTWNFENWSTAQGRGWIADSVVSQLEEARDAGVTKVILDVGFLVFDTGYKYRGVADVGPFVERLRARGLWDNVVALYPVDEPDLVGLDSALMDRVNTDLKQFGKPIACCFTDRRQYPGLSTVDWAGFDKYGVDVHGDGTLEDLKRRLRPEQRIMLFAGGADPWRDNVKPVLEYANRDPQVVAIIAFIYGDIGTGKGIRNNGMLPEYAEVGTIIKNAGKV